MSESLRDNPAARLAWNYPLFDAIRNRRSRLALGAEIPCGPNKYRSDKPLCCRLLHRDAGPACGGGARLGDAVGERA